MTRPLVVVLATGNSGKVSEFGRLFAGEVAVEPLPAGLELPEETGDTFAANAHLKAEAVFRALSGRVAVLADDSGLEVRALGGRPGVLSARFAGSQATDQGNVAKLLQELDGTSHRDARFVCHLCLFVPARGASRGDGASPEHIEVMGTTLGTITRGARGEEGFGYDPVFQPRGWEHTLAEASPAEKDGVSHRGRAARALLAALVERRLLDDGA
jgi:XTP/dITP diphosphohydrolase